MGNGHTLGERSGESAHILSINEMPTHTHVAQAIPGPGTQNVPANNQMLAQRAAEIYRPPTTLAPMVAGTVANAGSSQAHENRQPFLTLNFCIALAGIFPSRN